MPLLLQELETQQITWVSFYLGIKVPGNVGGKRDYVAASFHFSGCVLITFYYLLAMK